LPLPKVDTEPAAPAESVTAPTKTKSHEEEIHIGKRENVKLTRSSRRFHLMIVQLDIRIAHRFVETLDHRLNASLLGERVGEDVAVVISTDCCLRSCSRMSDDEARVDLRGVAEDSFPVGGGGRAEVKVCITEVLHEHQSISRTAKVHGRHTIRSEGSGGSNHAR
jgi:hypothetical protein